MRLLLLGGTGQVGAEFRALELPGGIQLVAPDRSTLDLMDPQSITDLIRRETWSVVINAAAYTEVDRAESEEATAFAINGEVPSLLAAETALRGIPLIHLSTDYVFDGRKGDPYVESDGVAPLNAYGRSKLAGERGVCSGNPRHIVLRTSWVYSPYRNNFVKTILRLAADRERLTIVDDQRGCPTAARDVARVCRDIAVRCATQMGQVRYGLYHYAGHGEASWFEFAMAIIEFAASRLSRIPQIVPIRTVDYPTPAVRPADTRLNCGMIEREFGIKTRSWREALEEVIAELCARKCIT